MKVKYLIIIPFILLFFGCSKNNRAFKESILPEGKMQLFITPVEYADSSKHFTREIEINDRIIIENIYNLKIDSSSEEPFYPASLGIISVNGKVYCNFWLNPELTIMRTYNGYFSINPNTFLRYHDKFSSLRKSVISIKEKEEAIKVKNVLDEQGYFISWKGITPKLEWEEFDGYAILKVDNEKVPFERREDFIKKIKNDLRKSIPDFRYDSYKKEDEFGYIKIFCNKPIDFLPENYKFLEEYKKFRKIQIEVLGVAKEELVRVLNSSNIDYLLID